MINHVVELSNLFKILAVVVVPVVNAQQDLYAISTQLINGQFVVHNRILNHVVKH